MDETFRLNRLGNIYGENIGTGLGGNVWSRFYLAPALMTMAGGRREPMIAVIKKESKLNVKV